MKLAVAVLLVLVSPKSLGQSTPPAAGDMGSFYPAEIRWRDGPASLPRGAKFAVLEGDPAKEGPFVMRFWLPDGFTGPTPPRSCAHERSRAISTGH